jgi:hypothetical protein
MSKMSADWVIWFPIVIALAIALGLFDGNAPKKD